MDQGVHQDLSQAWPVTGFAIPKDSAEAARMFRKAAEQGLATVR